MIKITKGQKPNVLEKNAEKWTEELLSHMEQGNEPPDKLQNKYNQKEVREALRRECYSKCMYCESKINHITFDHIEHIRPKAQEKYPELTFDWDNLGLACPLCNHHKSDKFDDRIPLVNPYLDEPSHHLVFAGCCVWHIAGDRRGELTHRNLKLNRTELIERRLERIDHIRCLADRYQNQSEPLKSMLRDQLRTEIAADKPYSMCSRAVLSAILPSDNIVDEIVNRP
jgi:uncharacterized protein (TIGR02646 family)